MRSSVWPQGRLSFDARPTDRAWLSQVERVSELLTTDLSKQQSWAREESPYVVI